jgi:hypothetical protein
MLYLATASGPAARAAIAAGRLGQMVTPDTGNRIVEGARWVLDNGCFGARWTPQRWSAVLDRHMATPGCLFAVVPDVVANAAATEDLWARLVSDTYGDRDEYYGPQAPSAAASRRRTALGMAPQPSTSQAARPVQPPESSTTRSLLPVPEPSSDVHVVTDFSGDI